MLDASSWRRIEELFLEALERAPHQRAAFLAAACADAPGLAGEVGRMLEAHEGEWRLLFEDRLARTVDRADAADLAGTRIGAYRLIRFLARGGMGDVYLAEREQPYSQRVALKLLRSGMVSDEAKTRFRQERQILARLTHPNITQILDGGVLDGDRPYLVLQYIEGRPITSYCDAHRLPLRERLRLFRTVCAAVGFAHRHLVIHRDLKPSNILVTDAGEVKLLDFGIAKLLDPVALDTEAVVTRDYRPMTLDSAAPEQIRGEPITTASDVYALGVLLHELVSGRKPFAGNDLTRSELERRICEERPPLPISPHKDLDNIILMALRKEPERRYASAEQLSLDVARFLANQPISARPDTLRYRCGKFLQRNKAAVALAAVSLLLLLGFTAFSVMQARALERERDSARSERNRAEHIVRLLTDLFEASNPEKVPGAGDLRVSEFLDRGTPTILAGLDGQPELQARMKLVLAEVHGARSEFAKAQQLADEALQQFQHLEGEDSPSTLEALRVVARLAMVRNGPPAAVPLMRDSLARHERVFAPNDGRLATAIEDLARALPGTQEQLTLLQRALEIRRRAAPPVFEDIAGTLNLLGIHYLESDADRAEALFAESLATYRRVYPETHPKVLDVRHSLADVYLRQSRLSLAEQTYRDVLQRRSGVLGPETMAVAESLNGLGVALAQQGRHAEAAEALQRSIALAARILGSGHWTVANDERNLAFVLLYGGRVEDAVTLMERAYRKFKAAPDRIDGVHFMHAQLGYMWTRAGRVADGLRALRESLQALEGIHPQGHAYVAGARVLLGRALLSHGSAPEAEAVFRQALKYRTSTLPDGHVMVAEVQCGLAASLAAQRRYDEAEPLFRRAFPQYSKWGLADPFEVEQVRRHFADASATRSSSSLRPDGDDLGVVAGSGGDHDDVHAGSPSPARAAPPGRVARLTRPPARLSR